MRRPLIAAAFAFVAVLTAAATAAAQQGPPGLPQLTPPPPPPVKPYQPVAVKMTPPFTDASFVAFRKQLGDVAAHKDRAALARLVVDKDFFWMQEKDLADQTKPGVDNLARAIDLDAQDGPGWEAIAGFAKEPTAAELPSQQGVLCAPADPTIDPQAFDSLIKSTATDPAEWGFPNKDGVEVHAAGTAGAPVTEKLGVYLVRVLPDSGQGADPNQPLMLHIALPSGKTGFIEAPSLSPLGSDQMCYKKEAGGWKITGYFGGVSQ